MILSAFRGLLSSFRVGVLAWGRAVRLPGRCGEWGGTSPAGIPL